MSTNGIVYLNKTSNTYSSPGATIASGTCPNDRFYVAFFKVSVDVNPDFIEIANYTVTLATGNGSISETGGVSGYNPVGFVCIGPGESYTLSWSGVGMWVTSATLHIAEFNALIR